MKKLIALILVTMAVSAQAQHHSYWHRGNWIAPMVIGGAVGYALTRNYYEPVYNYGYVPPPPVIVQQTVRSTCTPWTETQYADGTITRTRTCQ